MLWHLHSENQESQWGNSVLVWRIRTRSTDVKVQEEMCVPAQEKKADSLTFLFYSDPHWIGSCPTILVRMYLVIFFTQIQRPSQTQSEIMILQLSGHPLAQSSWHVKLTITGELSELMHINYFWNCLLLNKQ